MKKINDGWHKIYDCNVYVENGIVKHGTKKDINGRLVIAYPYKWYKRYNLWINESVKYSTLINGIKKGNWKLS